MKKSLIAIAVMMLLPIVALAEKKPVTEKASTTMKVTIDSIDHDNRMITFKDKDGNYQVVHAGPEIKRFDELKVGDQVTFKYTESVVYELKKPGEAAPPSGTGDLEIARNTSAKPGGTLSQKETVTVTVKAVDMKAPSVTVATEDGRSMSFKIKDKGQLKDVKPGDRLVITYSDALLISVE